MKMLEIVASIASKTGITLYLVSGEQMTLPNDSWKTKAIMDVVLPKIGRGETATIDLDEYSTEKKIEDKTEGVIRFIRQTMAQLQEMLNDLEGPDPSKPVAVTAPGESLIDTTQEQLMAVVKTPQGDVTIPGVGKMEKHLDHAARTGNVKGLQRFMERIAAVIKDRGHTVQELLNFMEKGDLPIADDGSIVAYKVLKTRSGDPEGMFVDCHTGKVQQRLGSRVSMDPKLVDPSRRTECSSGLHIARRGYIRGFSGNIITLVKVAPEDVIAVPQGEPNKMRAAAYHIVGVLPSEAHAALRENRPMTGNSAAAKLLADVIAGNHPKVLHQVRIGEEKGGNVRTRNLKAAGQPLPESGKNGEAKSIDDHEETKLTPKAVREIAQKAKEMAPAPEVKETKAQRDARRKREKRAAEKAAKNGFAGVSPVAQPATLDIYRKIPGESKRERDARIKREKNAAKKAGQV